MAVLKGTVGSSAVSVSITDIAVTASRGDHLVVSWDLGGRLYSFFDRGVTCRRGLNGRVLKKWRRGDAREREWATPDECDALLDQAAGIARELLDRIALFEPGPGRPRLEQALGRAAGFDGRAAREDAVRFRQVYRPIGILPPDQYLALVLQATEGCSFRSCTFCEFYREPYRVRAPADFAAHVGAVRAYLGDSIRLRAHAVFLGSANALAVRMSSLEPIFEVLARDARGVPVHAFLDGFTGTMKSAEDYAALARLGLRRVYVGLESGHDPLLAFVQKPATSGQAVETVRALEAGGVRVAVIVLVGLGGDRYSEVHIADTIAAVNAMGLGPGDILYFSDLVETGEAPYPRLALDASIRPLTADERRRQRLAIESGLRFPAAPPRIATYDIREFVY